MCWAGIISLSETENKVVVPKYEPFSYYERAIRDPTAAQLDQQGQRPEIYPQSDDTFCSESKVEVMSL